jgi:FeS assembly SUF system protein
MPKTKNNNLKNQIIKALKKVYDPELAVNVYDLGLIYDITITPQKKAHILMTLTTPFCPFADMFPIEIETAVREIPEITDVEVEITFDPPWDQEMMSDDAKLELGFTIEL